MKKEWQFKSALLCLVAFVMSLFTTSVKAQEEARFPVGIVQRTFHPAEPYNWRGAQTKALVTTVWYPAAVGAQEKPQFLGAPNSPFAILGSAAPEARMADAPARFPLIVLSHGTGGTAASMAWLGTQLAAHGYIAAAVNHPGNNGLEAYTTQGFVLWWERAHDLSTLIDHLLADPVLGKRVDPDRIGAAGFSLGGYTMMEIAGGVTDRSNFREFCKSPQADGICKDPPEFPSFMDKFSNADEIAKTDPGMQHSLEHASDSYRDPRVRAIFAMAPALGPAFRPESLRKVSIPVAIVAGSADQNVPVASSAQFFAKEIPRAELTLLPGATHYVFLFTCGQAGKNSRPLLCTDPPGIDRDAIHAKTSRLALEFFRKHL